MADSRGNERLLKLASQMTNWIETEEASNASFDPSASDLSIQLSEIVNEQINQSSSFERILNQLNEMVIFVGPEGEIVYKNTTFISLFEDSNGQHPSTIEEICPDGKKQWQLIKNQLVNSHIVGRKLMVKSERRGEIPLNTVIQSFNAFGVEGTLILAEDSSDKTLVKDLVDVIEFQEKYSIPNLQ